MRAQAKQQSVAGRVLTLLPSGFAGGVESVVLNLAHELKARQDVDFDVVRFSSSHRCQPRECKSDFIYNEDDQQIYTLRRLAGFAGKVPVLFVNGMGLDLSLGWYLRKWGTRVIYVVHGNSDYYFRSAKHYLPIIDRYVALTQEMAQNLKRHLGTTIPIDVIPNGVRVPSLCPERGQAGPIRILYLGRVENSLKALERSIAFVRELERLKIPYSFTLAGEGPYLPELKSQLLPLAEYGSIVFAGHVDRTRISQLMREQDVLVLFSRSEGMNMAMLEGMANGLIPVVMETEGVQAVIENGDNGFVLPQGDSGGMASVIDLLAQKCELRRGVQYQAWQSARERFDLKSMASQYSQLFTELEAIGPYQGHVPNLLCRRDLIDFTLVPNVLAKYIRRISKRLHK